MKTRISAIRNIAISKTEDTSIQEHIRIDRNGTIETMILDLLEQTKQKAIDLKLSEDTVNNEIASYIVYLIIEAKINNKKGN